MIAWVCIAASVIGVLLLIVDALRERNRTGDGDDDGDRDDGDRDDETAIIPAADATSVEDAEDYPDEPTETTEAETSVIAVQSHDDGGSEPKTESKKL